VALTRGLAVAFRMVLREMPQKKATKDPVLDGHGERQSMGFEDREDQVRWRR
jgi:hypothetical protein